MRALALLRWGLLSTLLLLPALSAFGAEQGPLCVEADRWVKEGVALGDVSDLAFSYFKRAVELCSSHPEANFRVGVIHQLRKNTPAALASFHAVVKSAPETATAHYNLGIIYRQKRSHARALASFREAVRLKPERPEFLYNLAVFLLREGKVAEAQKLFRKAVELMPSLAEAHFYLGAIYEEAEKHQEARGSLEKALELKPELVLVRIYLAKALEHEGKTQRARQLFNEALRMKPEVVRTGYGFEEFYYQEGGYNKILSEYRLSPLRAVPMETPSTKPPQAEKKEVYPPLEDKPAKAKKVITPVPLGATSKPEPKEGEAPESVEKPPPKAPEKPKPQAKGTPSPPKKKAASPPPKRKGFFYVVRRGDTIASIAGRFGLSPEALLRANRTRIEHPDFIDEGQRIYIPPKGP
ncbi:MAG: tetratricopeptide repeat protein [Nitrospinota bacterium]